MTIEPVAIHHLAVYPAYFDACRADGCEHYAGVQGSALVFFQRVLDDAAGRQLSPGRVPSQTWFALDDNGGIVGAIRLRLGTTAFIREQCGHIGYEVHPAARQLGVASRLLAYVQCHGAPQLDGGWIVTCDDDNLASRRTIEGAGGVLLEVRPPQPGLPGLCRYHLAAQAYGNSAAARQKSV